MKHIVILLLVITGCASPIDQVPNHQDLQQQCDEWADEMANRLLACGADQALVWGWLEQRRGYCEKVFAIDFLAETVEGCIEDARNHSCDPSSYHHLWCSAFLTLDTR